MTSAAAPHGFALHAERARDAAVPMALRAALALFVASIPFEWPGRIIPLEIPTATGFLLLGATCLAPRVCYRRVPPAFLAFAAYLWVFVVALLAAGVTQEALAFRLFVSQTLVILLFWALGNLFADLRMARLALLALVLACTARALLQVLDVGTTSTAEWTGGTRVTVLGQNANLSAIILSAGLVATFGAREAALDPPRWLRWGALPIAALIGVAIIQTGSRGGLLCAAAGLAAFCIRGTTVAARARNLVLAVGGVAVLAVAAMRSDMMRHRLAGASGGQLAGREQIYPAAAAAFLDRPLLGWGPIANQHEISRRMREGTIKGRDAHNLLLELLSATGALGAFPFLVGIALVLRGAWRARHGRAGPLPLAMLAATLTGTVSGTWIAAKILWLAFAVAGGAEAARAREA